jgi:hypothetical protein|tara:strand:- start:246 stop:386 length:141 start_codon:yes stop_codon:yes gene_type:complete
MQAILYFILFIFLYRALMRFISNPKIKETKNDKGIKYQDAEFKEID